MFGGILIFYIFIGSCRANDVKMPNYDIEINHANEKELQSLQLNIKTVKEIIDYLNAGGSFHTLKDFLRFMDKENIERIWPYIILTPVKRCGSDWDCFALNGGSHSSYLEKFRYNDWSKDIWSHIPEIK